MRCRRVGRRGFILVPPEARAHGVWIGVLHYTRKHIDVPMLSIGASRNILYHVYDTSNRTDMATGILKQLDFHPCR